MYNDENKYKKDMKTTIEYIAQYGTCNFICWDCEIEKQCDEYNHQRETALNQVSFRKKMAGEFLRGKNAK